MNVRRALSLAIAALLLAGGARIALSHCQIPCGIYDDEARIVLLREHITTVEKSMKQIAAIGAAEEPDWNQLVRWVNNKEEHAAKIQEIVTAYFMAQRVKLPAVGDAAARQIYLSQLTPLHALLVTAMKMKQTTDLAHVETARGLVDRFARAYFSKEDVKHAEEHHD